MSCYEWERGTITLPSAEAVPFRNAIKAAVDAHTKRAYEATQRFWKMLPPKAKRDKQMYQQWVNAFCYGNDPRSGNGHNSKLPTMPALERDDGSRRYGFTEDVADLLGYRALHKKVERDPADLFSRPWVDCPPRRILQTDVVERIGKATGTKFTVHCGEEPSFSVNGRVVTWEVPDNNHACDYGRDHPLAKKLFELLARVKWTRGSGGKIIGNNEYNRDDDNEGGGGNYVVQEFGPPHAPARRRQTAGARR